MALPGSPAATPSVLPSPQERSWPARATRTAESTLRFSPRSPRFPSGPATGRPRHRAQLLLGRAPTGPTPARLQRQPSQRHSELGLRLSLRQRPALPRRLCPLQEETPPPVRRQGHPGSLVAQKCWSNLTVFLLSPSVLKSFSSCFPSARLLGLPPGPPLLAGSVERKARDAPARSDSRSARWEAAAPGRGRPPAALAPQQEGALEGRQMEQRGAGRKATTAFANWAQFLGKVRPWSSICAPLSCGCLPPQHPPCAEKPGPSPN